MAEVSIIQQMAETDPIPVHPIVAASRVGVTARSARGIGPTVRNGLRRRAAVCAVLAALLVSPDDLIPTSPRMPESLCETRRHGNESQAPAWCTCVGRSLSRLGTPARSRAQSFSRRRVLAKPPQRAADARLEERYQLADLKALQDAFVALAEEVQPSVVAVRTYLVRGRKREDARGGSPPREKPSIAGSTRVAIPISQGSGFILDVEGHIVTNRHVLEDANAFAVILHTGQRFEASVRQTDPRTDLAVLKIDAEKLTPARLGDLADVRLNQWTFACGNPFGLANADGHTSITYGVVSALGRQMTDRLAEDRQAQYFGNLIETSSSISPGCSGGPLFNIDGDVIGVVTALATGPAVGEGHGYAIPIDKDTRKVLDTLKKGRVFTYGYMGVLVEDAEAPRFPFHSVKVASTGAPRGARLTGVDPPDGPAARAGLRKDDIVLFVDGVPVESGDHLVRLVQFSPVGAQVEVTYLRNNVKRTTRITLADRDKMLGLNKRKPHRPMDGTPRNAE
ncbi:MAG: S1C family serine protease [Phycisphaerae bacterium]